MKKIVALIMVFFFLLIMPALAEEEMMNLKEGVYREGVDIQTGVYSITCDSTSNGFCVVATFSDEEKYNSFTAAQSITNGLENNSEYYVIVQKGEDCTIRIECGTVLMIQNGSFSVTAEHRLKENDADISVQSKSPYEVLCDTLSDPELTSGEKMMARIRYWADVQYEGDMDAAISLYQSTMIASGYSQDEARLLYLKAQAGEELHPFHKVEYDIYNCPAEENGLEDDTLLISGQIVKYINDGSKKNCEYGFVVEDSDGNQWLVYCAKKVEGYLYGLLWGSKPEYHVFADYEGKNVSVYGKYLGYSEKYSLPVLDILTFGGMLDIETNTLVSTLTANHNLKSYAGIEDFAFILGALQTIESTERYLGR